MVFDGNLNFLSVERRKLGKGVSAERGWSLQAKLGRGDFSHPVTLTHDIELFRETQRFRRV